MYEILINPKSFGPTVVASVFKKTVHGDTEEFFFVGEVSLVWSPDLDSVLVFTLSTFLLDIIATEEHGIKSEILS